MSDAGDHWRIDSHVLLNDGIRMPRFGLGVYLTEGEDCTEAVHHALKCGYRMIDTAQFYENEKYVGDGVKKFLDETGSSRGEVFVVTKLWDDNHGASACRQAFTEELRKLHIGYVDLYLMHSPYGGMVVETYKEMLKLKDEGLIRSVGVSNFGVQHLEGLVAAGLPPPSVNQIELHPWQWQPKQAIVKYCLDKGIAVMGYAPLTKGERLDAPEIVRLAEKHGKTNAQILLRYSLQMNFITIPKSSKIKRIEENAAVFDWCLDDEDMVLLNLLPAWSCDWDPTISPWTG